jgi:hypothetical protein
MIDNFGTAGLFGEPALVLPQAIRTAAPLVQEAVRQLTR